MPFRFRLDRMLHLVELRELSKKQEVAKIVSHLKRLEKEKQQLKIRMLKNLEKLGCGEESMDWVPYAHPQVEMDSKGIDLVLAQIAAGNSELERKKEELLQITMRKKSLESLKEKRRFEYLVEERRQQDKELAEQFRMAKPQKQGT